MVLYTAHTEMLMAILYTTTGPPPTDDKDTTAESGPTQGQVASPVTITYPTGKGIAKV